MIAALSEKESLQDKGEGSYLRTMKQLWNDYLTYINDNPKGYWFKRKLYGWGWAPARPAGWITIGVYLFVVLGIIFIAEGNQELAQNPKWIIGSIVAATFVLLAVSWRTGEPPKWQWGGRQEKNK